MARTTAELCRFDVLVNNAGDTRPIKFIEMNDRQADKQIDINLKSLAAANQAAAKAMIAGGAGGSITTINIARIKGLRAASGCAVYAVCKAGMLNFTRTAALELVEHGIRVNAIAPDLVVPAESMARVAPGLLSAEGRAAQMR